MISTILFSLSALCFAAMFAPGKSSKPLKSSEPVYTYYVCDDAPIPTWKRKFPVVGRVSERVG